MNFWTSALFKLQILFKHFVQSSSSRKFKSLWLIQSRICFNLFLITSTFNLPNNFIILAFTKSKASTSYIPKTFFLLSTSQASSHLNPLSWLMWIRLRAISRLYDRQSALKIPKQLLAEMKRFPIGTCRSSWFIVASMPKVIIRSSTFIRRSRPTFRIILRKQK